MFFGAKHARNTDLRHTITVQSDAKMGVGWVFGVWARISPGFEAVSRRRVLLGPLGDSPTELSGGGGAVAAVNAWWDVVVMVSPGGSVVVVR